MQFDVSLFRPSVGFAAQHCELEKFSGAARFFFLAKFIVYICLSIMCIHVLFSMSSLHQTPALGKSFAGEVPAKAETPQSSQVTVKEQGSSLSHWVWDTNSRDQFRYIQTICDINIYDSFGIKHGL